MPVIPKNLFPKDKISDVKPGDLLTLTVSRVDESKIELDYDTVNVNKLEERVPKEKLDKMDDKELRSMPLSRLEKSLPKTERE